MIRIPILCYFITFNFQSFNIKLVIENLIDCSVASSTMRNYKSAGLQFLGWLHSIRHKSLYNIMDVLDYVEILYNQNKSYSSANKFRSWLALQEIKLMGKHAISNDERLKRALKGFRSSRIKGGMVKVTIPIIQRDLDKLLESSKFKDDAKHMLVISYVFLLRFSEAADILNKISYITKEKIGWVLHLARSKNDPLQKGFSVFFPDELVPQKYLGFLYDVSDRKSKSWISPSAQFMNNEIKEILGSKKYHYHGIRHGRTMDLIGQGIRQDKIQILGRWKSMAGFKCYIHKE